MKPKTPPQAPKTPLYTLSGKINDNHFSIRTDNVREAIKALEPEEIFTESYITLTKGEGAEQIVNEQKLDFTKTKRVFRDDDVLNIFVQNLLTPFN